MTVCTCIPLRSTPQVILLPIVSRDGKEHCAAPQPGDDCVVLPSSEDSIFRGYIPIRTQQRKANQPYHIPSAFDQVVKVFTPSCRSGWREITKIWDNDHESALDSRTDCCRELSNRQKSSRHKSHLHPGSPVSCAVWPCRVRT
jgi:hypothetical protein